MSKLSRVRDAFIHLADLWKDRHIHIPAFKAGVRSIPSRLRSADPVQRRNLLIAVGIIILLQILIFMTGL